MSSHREAPEISKDPVADNTDTYAFRSPDKPDTVTLIANFIPFERGDAGPNFFEFGEDVVYNLYIDQTGNGVPDITYQFNFSVQVQNPNSFLYNTGPISFQNGAYQNWNRVQTYSVRRIDRNGSTTLGTGLLCPPCNIGPRSTPNYSALAQAAIHSLASGETVFAGQRIDPFYVDLGGAFDLLTLRPFENLQRFQTGNSAYDSPKPGVDSLQSTNVHSIALQIPIGMVTTSGAIPQFVLDRESVIGVWAAAGRSKSRILMDLSPFGNNSGMSLKVEAGPSVQVSRLGNPLVNEVLIPMGKKDLWNRLTPAQDSQFLQYYLHPEVQNLLPLLYPAAFPNLAKQVVAPNNARTDLAAILLTGLPPGIVPGFQNYTGGTFADMLRLNLAVPPSSSPNVYGLVGGDAAGWPNGRRPYDDTTTVELRAIAGATLPLVQPSYTPDAAAGAIYDVTNPPPVNGSRYMSTFPYLGLPQDGFNYQPSPYVADAV